MPWVRWLTVALCAVQGGYLAFDGLRAIVVGSYVTPSSGDHAGELGPWARVVSAVGIPPASTGMKAGFVLLGTAWMVCAAGLAAGAAGPDGWASRSPSGRSGTWCRGR
jgi:hypothetical protein